MASWLDDAEAVIEVISRKWAVPVLGALADGPRRHNELLRAVGCGIHPTVLDGTLRHLEQAGLVRREASTGTPLASWYQLTDLSRSLNGVGDVGQRQTAGTLVDHRKARAARRQCHRPATR